MEKKEKEFLIFFPIHFHLPFFFWWEKWNIYMNKRGEIIKLDKIDTRGRLKSSNLPSSKRGRVFFNSDVVGWHGISLRVGKIDPFFREKNRDDSNLCWHAIVVRGSAKRHPRKLTQLPKITTFEAGDTFSKPPSSLVSIH